MSQITGWTNFYKVNTVKYSNIIIFFFLKKKKKKNTCTRRNTYMYHTAYSQKV